jgi:hypothetical protein
VDLSTAYAVTETTIKAMKRGGFDNLPKPVDPLKEREMTRAHTPTLIVAQVGNLSSRPATRSGPFACRPSASIVPHCRRAEGVWRVGGHGARDVGRRRSGAD